MKVLFRGLCLEGPTFQLMPSLKTKGPTAAYSHRTVWPLLVADKVVGGEHHLADVTVKAGFMPVLREGGKKELECDFAYKWSTG